MKKRILDMCCGSRMFYFDKHDPNVLFTDIREYHDTLCDGRKLDVQPDMIADCTSLPFEDETFNMVVRPSSSTKSRSELLAMQKIWQTSRKLASVHQ